ncbi:Cyclin-T1-3 [Hibiscus syriacus]|uniref:Cyclin-T1-3 n=1 Tax=Hibiscus syriacus TaxID=106335 RepID=A0A6A2Y2P1_HIBSY|nr:Cyclin-T1-3 [Hibiscus syriacus]
MFLDGKVEETHRPLKDVILVSYEIINKKDPAASQKVKQKSAREVEGSAGGGTSHRALAKHPSGSEEKQSRSTADHSSADNHGMPSRTAQNRSNDNGSGETGSVITDHKMDIENKDSQHHEQLPHKDNMREVSNKSRSGMERTAGEDLERSGGRNEIAETGEWRDDGAHRKVSNVVGRNLDTREGPVGQSPKEAIKIDRDKLKAALEKRRKSRGETTKKKDVMDEDDLIGRELEDGVELAVEDEKIRRERRQSWSKDENQDHWEMRKGNQFVTKEQSSKGIETEAAEEGEMLDDASPIVNGGREKVEAHQTGSLKGRSITSTTMTA